MKIDHKSIMKDYECRMAVARFVVFKGLAEDYAAINPVFARWCRAHANALESIVAHVDGDVVQLVQKCSNMLQCEKTIISTHRNIGHKGVEQ